MSLVSLAAIYFVTWFIVLLAALPFGVRRQENPEPGTDLGAPEHPFLWWKAGTATVLAALITAGIWLVIGMGWFSFRPV